MGASPARPGPALRANLLAWTEMHMREYTLGEVTSQERKDSSVWESSVGYFLLFEWLDRHITKGLGALYSYLFIF